MLPVKLIVPTVTSFTAEVPAPALTLSAEVGTLLLMNDTLANVILYPAGSSNT